MKRFPKLVAAAALVAGASALTAPLAAKEKPAAAAQPSYSPNFIKAAKPAQDALKGSDANVAEPLVAAAEAAATTDDDRYASSLMRVQVISLRMRALPAGQQTDQSVYNAPLEALVNNPKTPAEQRQKFAYQRGAIAYQMHKPADAVTWFNRAKELGYNDADFTLALAQAKMDAGDIAGGTADINSAISAMGAAGQKAPESYYRYALAKTVEKKMRPESVQWIQRWLVAYPSAKNWHDALTIYGLQQGSLITPDKAQTVDLFRLMRQNRALDQFGYEEYAQKVIDSGLPDEAKALVAEGRANGKLPAGTAATELATSAARGVASEGSLATLEAKARAGASGALASQTADAYLGKGDYAKAVALYRVALTKGGVNADQVNTHLGIALALSGDKAGARTAFGAVTGAPRSDIAQFWTVWLDHPATA